jgi:hypothetical protein
MRQSAVIDLDSGLALMAAVLGLWCKLPLADSVVYATAQRAGAILWTQDAGSEGLEGVTYWPKA